MCVRVCVCVCVCARALVWVCVCVRALSHNGLVGRLLAGLAAPGMNVRPPESVKCNKWTSGNLPSRKRTLDMPSLSSQAHCSCPGTLHFAARRHPASDHIRRHGDIAGIGVSAAAQQTLRHVGNFVGADNTLPPLAFAICWLCPACLVGFVLQASLGGVFWLL
jgi:hypothetical protein